VAGEFNHRARCSKKNDFSLLLDFSFAFCARFHCLIFSVAKLKALERDSPNHSTTLPATTHGHTQTAVQQRSETRKKFQMKRATRPDEAFEEIDLGRVAGWATHYHDWRAKRWHSASTLWRKSQYNANGQK
jgi:hypothetical protein